MKNITAYVYIQMFVLCAIMFAPSTLYASTTNGTIDASFKITRVCKNVTCSTYGQLNWKPTINAMTPGAQPVTITDTAITGHVWGDEIGWIKLNQIGLTGPQTLKVNPNTGVVTGFAYANTGSWINFSPTQATTSTTTVGVTINTVGEFVGWAWASGAYGGWIKFDCGGVGTCIKTDWRPIAHREACQNGIDDDNDGLIDLADAGCTSATGTSEVNVIVPPSGGGGGGGGGPGFGGITPPGTTNNQSNPTTNQNGPQTTNVNNTNTGNNQNTQLSRSLPSFIPQTTSVKRDDLEAEDANVEKQGETQIQGIRFTFGDEKKVILKVERVVVQSNQQTRSLVAYELPIGTKLKRSIQSTRTIVSVESVFDRTSDLVNYSQKTVYAKQTFWQWLKKKLLFAFATPVYANESFVDNVDTPTETGLYTINSTVHYSDGATEQLPEEEVIVLPKGIIFYRPGVLFNHEFAIRDAKVSLYKKDKITGAFTLASQDDTYDSVNTIQTDATGTYVFNVNKGIYVLRVEKDGFISSEIGPFEVTQDAQVINDRIEIRYKSVLPLVHAWDIKIIIFTFVLFLYRNYRRNTKKMQREKVSTRK